jgi:hypothetical protein
MPVVATAAAARQQQQQQQQQQCGFSPSRFFFLSLYFQRVPQTQLNVLPYATPLGVGC